MQPYQLRLLNRDGSTDCFDLGAFADDTQAAAHAKAALHVSLCAVSGELWRGELRLARILRDCGRTKPTEQPRRMAG